MVVSQPQINISRIGKARVTEASMNAFCSNAYILVLNQPRRNSGRKSHRNFEFGFQFLLWSFEAV